jgi:hypothetical protein
MKATYMKRFQKLYHTLKNTDLVDHARMDEHNTFSRKRKMPLEYILYLALPERDLPPPWNSVHISNKKRICLWKYRNKAICSKGDD